MAELLQRGWRQKIHPQKILAELTLRKPQRCFGGSAVRLFESPLHTQLPFLTILNGYTMFYRQNQAAALGRGAKSSLMVLR
jgi:hypothetical protein